MMHTIARPGQVILETGDWRLATQSLVSSPTKNPGIILN
jgi:hypothetical protein